MSHSIRRQLATVCILSILLALAILLSPRGLVGANAAQETTTTYTLHMKKATNLAANSICDSLFAREAQAVPGSNGLVDVTIWVVDPIPNYPNAGRSITSLDLSYDGTTYPASLDPEHKVTKSFSADAMFFPSAGDYEATPVTFSIPQAAIDASPTGALKCSVYVNAVLSSQQEFYMVMTAPSQGEKAAEEEGDTGKSSTTEKKTSPSKKASSKKKSFSKKSSGKKKTASSTVTTCTYSYQVSMRKTADFSTNSICNPLFSSTARVVISSGLAKITLWVIDPIPNYKDEGTPLSNVKFAYKGKTYKANYSSNSKVKKSFGKDSMFISKAGSYPATPITVTLPAAAVKASANGKLKCSAFIRAVLKTSQSFYTVLSHGKLVSKSTTSKASKLTASKSTSSSSSVSASNKSGASSGKSAGKKSSVKSTARTKTSAAEVDGELPCKTGTAHGSYTHPVTQEVADSAGPVGQTIGQAMVDKVIDPTCLLQTGNATWITLRFNMANSISNIRFQAQEPNTDTWEDAAFSVTATGDSTEDLRIRVTSQDTILKCVFHVTPIDRDVTFFIYEDGWTDGNYTNFATMTISDEAEAMGNSDTSVTTLGDANASSRPNVIVIAAVTLAALIIVIMVVVVLIRRRKKR